MVRERSFWPPLILWVCRPLVKCPARGGGEVPLDAGVNIYSIFITFAENHLLDRFKMAESIFYIREQVAAFDPFVP